MAVKEVVMDNPMTESIDQIREIIFGEQEKDYELRLQELKQQCEQLHSRLAALESQQQSTQHTLKEDYVRVEAYQNGQQELRTWIEKAQAELERKIEKLAANKVDRSQIGQAFIEWGMKVKQESGSKK